MKAKIINLEIPVECFTHDDGSCFGSPKMKGYEGAVSQGKNEEEFLKNVRRAMGAMTSFYMHESTRLRRMSIWESNRSKDVKSFWFTIVGIGLSFHKASKEFKKPKIGKKRLRVFGWSIRVINFWRKPKTSN